MLESRRGQESNIARWRGLHTDRRGVPKYIHLRWQMEIWHLPSQSWKQSVQWTLGVPSFSCRSACHLPELWKAAGKRKRLSKFPGFYSSNTMSQWPSAVVMAEHILRRGMREWGEGAFHFWKPNGGVPSVHNSALEKCAFGICLPRHMQHRR